MDIWVVNVFPVMQLEFIRTVLMGTLALSYTVIETIDQVEFSRFGRVILTDIVDPLAMVAGKVMPI